MSEVKVNLTEAEAGTHDDPAGPHPDPVKTACTDRPDLQG